MTADESLITLSEFLDDDPGVQVVLGATLGNDYSLTRLNLYAAVAGDFRSILKAFAKKALKRNTRAYDAGYNADAHELTIVDLKAKQYHRIASIVEDLSAPTKAPLLSKQDAVGDHLRFYAIVARSPKQTAIFLRHTTTKFEIGRTGLALMFAGNSFNKLDEKAFLFDRDIDCVAWDDYMYIASDSQFRRIFDYFDELEQRATEAIDGFVKGIPILNEDEFREAVAGQPQMLSKISRIAGKPYLANLTVAKIKAFITKYDLDIELSKDAKGKERLVFSSDLRRRWNILKLMDDDFLSSELTSIRYETNSKSAL